MKDLEKILELIESGNASDEELISIAGNNAEAVEFVNTYKKLNNIYSSMHISIDELKEYILFKNGMEKESASVEEKVPSIMKHLANCIKCNNEYKTLAGELIEIDLLLKKELHKQEEPKIIPLNHANKRISYFRYAAAIMIIPFVFAAASLILQPGAYKFASIGNNDDMFTTRGRSAVEYLKAAELINAKKYEEAITILNEDVTNNRNDETVFYSYYLTGLLNLEIAESSFAGFFKHYNAEKVNRAIVALNKCIELNNSGKFNNVNLDAEFYLGKAYLMLKNTEEAKKHFRIVVEQKGSQFAEADDILKNID